MDIATTLIEFSERAGVSGREDDAAEYVQTLLRRHADPASISRTALGGVVCAVRPAREGRPHLLLDAHLDEVGVIVTRIEESGYLRVAASGDLDRRALPAAAVTVHSAAGPVRGMVAVPPMPRTGVSATVLMEDVLIDIGCDSKSRAEACVAIGDAVSMHAPARSLLCGQLHGKAIDDHSGCVALLLALEQLADDALDCGLTVLFSSLEETGCAGAKTAAHAINPTHAVAVDVSFGMTPDAPRARCGELFGGPMIGVSPILSRRLTERMVELAKANDIPYQFEVMGNRTNTNADQIATTRAGVATALLSIPLKYMHSPVETVAMADIESTARLLAAFARDLAKGETA